MNARLSIAAWGFESPTAAQRPCHGGVGRLVAAVLAVGAVVWTYPVGAQAPGGPPPERIMQFLDRNRNNQLDPEELQRMPPPLRDAFGRFGLNGSRPISLAELQRVLPRVWEEMRRQREEREREYRRDGRDRDDDRDDGRREYDRDGRGSDRSSGRRSAPPQRPRFQPRKREPVTYALPEQWQPLDKNGDNQLGLYEMPRDRWSEFRKLDLNGDGFATPAEIIYVQKKESAQAAAATNTGSGTGSAVSRTTPTTAGSQSPGRTPSGDVVRTRGPFGRPGDGPPGGGSRRFGRRGGGGFGRRDGGAGGPSEQYARYVFQVLDRNRDGALDAEEWQRSQRTRQSFERAGVTVSFPMNFDVFWQRYQQVGGTR
ncbi:MAG: hypothetical protein D6725_06855 [Planctomycetota bacterium]|nr:MAG: hypothetical protein D6725_06855 [Planctomycetota bacterium]